MNTNILFNISEKIGESVSKSTICRIKYDHFLRFISEVKTSNSISEKTKNITKFLIQSERAYIIRGHELIKLRNEYIK